MVCKNVFKKTPCQDICLNVFLVGQETSYLCEPVYCHLNRVILGFFGSKESLEGGSFTINSIAMSCQGPLGIGSGCSIP